MQRTAEERAPIQHGGNLLQVLLQRVLSLRMHSMKDPEQASQMPRATASQELLQRQVGQHKENMEMRYHLTGVVVMST